MLTAAFSFLMIVILFAVALAWMIVISKRATRLWASTNQTDIQGMNLNLLSPVGANSGIGPLSNDPIVLGRGTSPSFGMALVCQSSYTPPTGTPSGFCSYAAWGVFNLTVQGKSSIGGGGLAFFPGDTVYADGGTYDPLSGMLYGFTLNGNSTGGVKFGVVLDPVLSGASTIVRVRLKTGA